MTRTRIKFCGITRPQDALAAAATGADAIGLIFYEKSSRYVSIEQARDILKALPPMVVPVALFVNSPIQTILQTTQSLNIRTVQLHGQEDPHMLPELSQFTVIKALQCDTNLPASIKAWHGAAAILLETPSHDHGGTGVENNWAAIESLQHSKTNLPPLIAAGGLTPENVTNVIRRIHPYAVDVSSGIEQSKGIKSVEKMNHFAAAVRSADNPV